MNILKTASRERAWQLTLYEKSLKKRETVKAILRFLPEVADKQCLEIGCATGITSYFLRQHGGNWLSVDFEQDHVDATRALVGDGVSLIGEDSLPFAAERFDVVVGINFLEHIADDDRFLAEMARVLRPGGTLVFTAPTGEVGRLGYYVKRAYGFTADQEGFGHARDGYPPSTLAAKFAQAGLELEQLDTYSRFFGEAVEDTLNYLYHRKAAKNGHGHAHGAGEDDFHGATSPMSEDAFRKVSLSFRLYSLAFPAIKAMTLLDRLIPFSPGYMLVARAHKRPEGAR